VSFESKGKVGDLVAIGDGGYSMSEDCTNEENERTRQNGLLLDEWSESLGDMVVQSPAKKRRESSVFKPGKNSTRITQVRGQEELPSRNFLRIRFARPITNKLSLVALLLPARRMTRTWTSTMMKTSRIQCLI